MAKARILCVIVVLMLTPGVLVSPTHVDGAAGIKTYDVKGLDSCAAPTQSQMQTLWNNSPYWHWYIYIGGVARACSQPNLTATWVTNVRNQGWGLMPIWVGPQAPCTNFVHKFSYVPMTAWTQGVAEADAAYNKAISLGMQAPHAIVYDLEAFSTDSACTNAVDSFVSAWVWQLHNRSAGEKAGLYGSSCGSNLETLYYITSPRPDWIWGADWDNIQDVANMACVGSNHWTGYTRHKQYKKEHFETWGGVTVNVDSDCAYGPMYANQDRIASSC